jgi:L-amino acid N-acyltransferase YncA
MNLTTRFAAISDLPRIVEIYNQGVAAGNANADIELISTNDRIDWFKDHDRDSFPIYIIETADKIIGWGSLSPYRKGRGGLRRTAEISYYVDYNFQKQGIGKKLIGHMLEECSRLGIQNVFAIMLDINPPSAGILEYFGFEKWGHLPGIVNLKGKICGQLIYGKNLKGNTENHNILP